MGRWPLAAAARASGGRCCCELRLGEHADADCRLRTGLPCDGGALLPPRLLDRRRSLTVMISWQVDQRTGGLVAVEDEILGLSGTQIGLLAGGGRLLVLGA